MGLRAVLGDEDVLGTVQGQGRRIAGEGGDLTHERVLIVLQADVQDTVITRIADVDVVAADEETLGILHLRRQTQGRAGQQGLGTVGVGGGTHIRPEIVGVGVGGVIAVGCLGQRNPCKQEHRGQQSRKTQDGVFHMSGLPFLH